MSASDNDPGYWDDRPCLRPPIPALFDAAWTLGDAVDAHLAGKASEAADLIAATNTEEIRGYGESMWGAKAKHPEQKHYLRRREATGLDALGPPTKNRQPNKATKIALIARDGYHCKYCGVPVIPADVRWELNKAYPDALPWGKTNPSQHAAFQALWLQYDLILPARYGGSPDPGNIVISCAPCNYAKWHFHLSELGLSDPRDRAPKQSSWDGLTRLGAQAYV